MPLSKQRRIGARQKAIPLALALAGLALVFHLECTPYGATDANFALAKQREARGAMLYDRECAGCHGPRGEGLASTPPVMGPDALRTYVRQPSSILSGTRQRARNYGFTLERQPFFTADDVYDYVANHRRWVGHCCPVRHTSEEYWEIVSYILVGHGSNVPPGGVDQHNAKAVPIEPARAAPGRSAPY